MNVHGMSWLNLLWTAWRGLVANPLRAGLTALGIMIGVASVIITLALGNGARAAVEASFRFLGANEIQVSTKRELKDGEFSESGKKLLYAEVLNLPDQVELVKRVEMTVGRSVKIRHGRYVLDMGLNGTTADAFNSLQSSGDVQPIDWAGKRTLQAQDFLAWGRFYSPAETLQDARVCVLGFKTADDLFAGEDPIGQVVWINRRPYAVIGVLAELEMVDPEQRRYNDPNEALSVPIGAAISDFYDEEPSVDAMIEIKDAGQIDQAKADIAAYFRQAHAIMPDADGVYADDFSLTSKKDLLGAQQEAARAFSVLLTAMAIVSLSVGGIGIMNVMLVSITERTHEIGVRLAVGARTRDITLQFLLEAVLLSAASGVLGIAVGVLTIPLAAMLNQGAALLAPASIPLAFGVALVTGVVFGFYPALRAARLDPIEALRYE